MWKLSRRGGQARPTSRATGAVVAALVLVGALTLPASITLACDDDYREPRSAQGYVPYPQPGPAVVYVEPRERDGRYEHWRRERARRYWNWRGGEHRHHHNHGWD